MIRFSQIPLPRKLVLITTVATVTSLVVACVAFVAYDLLMFRQSVIERATTLAQAIGDNSTAALSFGDPQAAEETLAALKAEPSIVAAEIRTRDNKPFARYARQGFYAPRSWPTVGVLGYAFDGGDLVLVHGITFNRHRIGAIYLRSSFHEPIVARLKRYGGIVFCVMVVSSLAGLVISAILQRTVSRPLLDLARTAHVVRDGKDYSIRAIKRSEDEIGVLIDAFNQMLEQIHERDEALRCANDQLEQRVQERTEQLQQELAERKRAEEQLRQAQKMEAVGRLAGGVAHDFNNLLTVITGYCDLLLRDANTNGSVRKDIEEVYKASERAASLTRQLLAFSRKQVLQPKILNANDVVGGMEKMLRRLIGENIELRTVLAKPLGCVKADRGQLEQVILNLAVNARDAMPRGGNLTIETANVALDQKSSFHHRDLESGQYVMLAVSDTGIGMTEAVLTHLFEPFFTTKGLGKGTGLGLATCYGIVKQSGGDIRVHSEPNRGTTFKIYLPCAGQASAVETAAREMPDLPRGSETLLLVEDEASLRALAADVLRGCGYTVYEAEDGEAGLRIALIEYARGFDLIISDIIMPRVGGTEMVEAITIKHPEVKVLFTSGYTDDALADHGVINPGVQFLEKPFSPPQLAAKVREVLDQRDLVVA